MLTAMPFLIKRQEKIQSLLSGIAPICPSTLFADKAHETDAIRANLKNAVSILSYRRNPIAQPQSVTTKSSTVSATALNSLLGHLKINRAITTRYDQLADSFLGMLIVALARYWINLSMQLNTTLADLLTALLVGTFPRRRPANSPLQLRGGFAYSRPNRVPRSF